MKQLYNYDCLIFEFYGKNNAYYKHCVPHEALNLFKINTKVIIDEIISYAEKAGDLLIKKINEEIVEKECANHRCDCGGICACNY